ncbi:MAG TPA: hypothetical protein VML19_10745 [Verrucomicrobiae bacterium]|nr:hypothetical protein [Verrucomicrobiae bacterium]
MALADLTKQLAQQAILSATSSPKEAPAAPSAPNAGLVFLAQIQAMQKAIKDDEELLITLASGTEKIRVMEIFLPSSHVAILSGLDANRQPVRVISAVEALQLVSRVTKVAAGAKPVRIGLITPKPKDSSA